jgi:Tfp pilus assembly protein PilO
MQLPGISNVILKNLKKDEYHKYLELMPDFKQEKTQKYITIALTLIASIILGIFALGPTLSTIASLQKQLDDDKFVEQKLKEKINNLSVLQQKYASLEQDLPVINDALPKTSQIPLLTAQIQAVAQESNIKITNYQTFQAEVSHQAVSTKKFATYNFNVVTQGSYQDMTTFLDKLVNFQRIVSIESVSITKVAGINTTDLKLTVKGIAYFKE